MESNVFVGFNTTVENDVALRKIAAERRVDKTAVLNEAVSAYLAVQDATSVRVVVDALLGNHMTALEAEMALDRIIHEAQIETRAALEAEWSGYNDRD